MKNNRHLISIILICLIISIPACKPTTAALPSPVPLQNETLTAVPSPSREPSTATVAAPPSPTATTQASPTATQPPTATPVSFLPPGLVMISPENAATLFQVAVLPEQGATVVAFSPDSSWMAAGLSRTSLVKVWNLASGEELLSLGGHTDARIIAYLAFSPAGDRLASGAQGWEASNDSLILWEAGTGREIKRFNGVLGAVSPDWQLVALSQREQEEGVTLTLSSLESGEVVHSMSASGDIYGVTFSPDGRQVSARMYDVFQDLFSFWSVEDGKLNSTQYDWLSYSYSPDGRFVAGVVLAEAGSDKGELAVFDGVTFQYLKTLGKNCDALWYTQPAFSPDSKLLAASCGSQVTVWETQTWSKLVTIPNAEPAGLAFSPDGRLLTTFTLRGAVRLLGIR